MATATRELSAGPNWILAGKREKQNNVPRDDCDGSILSQEHVDLARSENHAQDRYCSCRATLRIAPCAATQPAGGRKPSLTDDDFTNPDGISYKNMKRKIAVGVLGYGYWGPLLVRNFKSLPDCQLKVVCDVNTARLKRLGTLYPDLEVTSDPQQF